MDDKIKNRFFSNARLRKYKNYDEYEENLKYSKQYYIPLALVEISLRNSIDEYFRQKISYDWLDDNFLHVDSIKKIEEVKKRVALSGKKIDNDKIISELSFGFWTSFFRKSYSKTMRLSAIKSIFPNIPQKSKKLITRDYINQKLNCIRVFRNSIFHYDKIINKPQYANIEDEIYEILNYFDSNLVKYAKELNRE